MLENDNLQRFIFENSSVRGEYIRLTESFQTITSQHNYSGAVKHLLGEALCVVALLTAIIKFQGRISVQFRGNGKLKMLLAQCNDQFALRGLVKFDGELSEDDIKASFEDGVLAIMLNSDDGAKNYQGVVAWRGDSLAESIEGYFKDSEQLDTKLWLSVNDHSAAGFLLQAVPNAEQNEMEQEATGLEWARLTSAAEKIPASELLQHNCESLLRHIYPEDDIRVFESQSVVFKCTCTRKRGEDAILMLGQAEAEAEVEEKQVLTVTCDFCNKEYEFDKVDVAALFANRGSANNGELH